MKKLILFLCITIFLLCSCSVSSTSTINTTVSTNEGTTSTTITSENGITTSDTLTATDDDPTGLRAKWKEYFSQGAEGVSEDGYNIYLAYDDPESINFAAIMILNEDNSQLFNYLFGDVVLEEDHYEIVDVEGNENLPFNVTDKEVEDGFEMTFQDGDSVELHFVDQETIIDHMIGLWEQHQQAYQANHQ